jgi:hypothetical protein
MFRSKTQVLAVLAAFCWLASVVQAADPVLLKYKFAKGDQLIYKSTEESKQTQSFMGNKADTVTKQEIVTLRTAADIDSKGTANLKTKAERRKVTVKGPGGDFAFDSKSTERDTTSAIGSAATPLLERMTGSEYEVSVSPHGSVVDVKGLSEMVADLVKDNPIAQQFGGAATKAGAMLSEQPSFAILSEKPVSIGDQWEQPFEVEMEKFGKIKGKVVYMYEADDKVGERNTVRIGTTTEMTLELNFEATGAKVSGTLTAQNATGTFQFDPLAGRVLSAKRNSTVSGQLSVEVGGMTIPIDTTTEENLTIVLLNKLPD